MAETSATSKITSPAIPADSTGFLACLFDDADALCTVFFFLLLVPVLFFGPAALLLFLRLLVFLAAMFISLKYRSQNIAESGRSGTVTKKQCVATNPTSLVESVATCCHVRPYEPLCFTEHN